MQAEGFVGPEFDIERLDAIADPVRRTRDLAQAEFRGVDGDGLFKGEAVFHGLALLARPGADAAVAGAAGEIGVGLRQCHFLHLAAQAHLSPQALPMEIGGGLEAGVEFASLGALPVGVEDEATLIEIFHQHHAQIGHALRIDGRDRHGGGIVGFALARQRQGLRKTLERLGFRGALTVC